MIKPGRLLVTPAGAPPIDLDYEISILSANGESSPPTGVSLVMAFGPDTRFTTGWGRPVAADAAAIDAGLR
ncbi:MAG: hypothetical protein ACK5X9_19220, partial [Alphaproteobacteria bacterium]